MRIYELLKETDLENLSYAQFQGVAEKLFIEPENEDEMRRLVLVQLARMAVRGDWDGFLNGGGGSGAPTDAEYLLAFDGSVPASLTAARKLVAGNNVSLAHGVGANDDMTISATPGGSDGQIQFNNSGVLSASGLLATNKTNELTIVAISGDGQINISSSTKAVSLLCDENQKLKVKGASDTFVLDVSSSSGGITFPDGTTQTTAASGGGGAYAVIPDLSDLTLSTSPSQLQQLMGINSGNSGTNVNMSGFRSFFFYRPFYAFTSGQLQTIHYRMNGSQAGSTMDIAFYSSNSDGQPNTKIGNIVGANTASSGTLSATISEESTGSMTLTKGELYWIGIKDNFAGSTAQMKGHQDYETGILGYSNLGGVNIVPYTYLLGNATAGSTWSGVGLSQGNAFWIGGEYA